MHFNSKTIHSHLGIATTTSLKVIGQLSFVQTLDKKLLTANPKTQLCTSDQ